MLYVSSLDTNRNLEMNKSVITLDCHENIQNFNYNYELKFLLAMYTYFM